MVPGQFTQQVAMTNRRGKRQEPVAGDNLLDRDVVGQQLAEDAAVADPPSDQLGVLAPVVEHHDGLGCAAGAPAGGLREGVDGLGERARRGRRLTH